MLARTYTKRPSRQTEINALNATMAVIAWKQGIGFYKDAFKYPTNAASCGIDDLGRARQRGDGCGQWTLTSNWSTRSRPI